MIGAYVRLRLDHAQPDDFAADLERRDRHAMEGLQAVPDGSRLVVSVGRRRIVTISAVRALRKADRRLCVDIEAADATTARVWRDAVVRGEAT